MGPSDPGHRAAPTLAESVSQAIRDAFLFRAEVRAVAPGTLPRFEMKAQRIARKGAKDAKNSALE